MAAVAKNPKFAKKAGVSSAVGKEFLTADKGKTFKEGGTMKHSDMKMDKKVVKKAVGMHDKQQHGGKKTDMSKLKSGGMAAKKMAYGGLAPSNFKPKGPISNQPAKVPGQGTGSISSPAKQNPSFRPTGPVSNQPAKVPPGRIMGGSSDKFGRLENPIGKSPTPIKKMAKGGGCEVRGKTKGTMIKMKKGGSC